MSCDKWRLRQVESLKCVQYEKTTPRSFDIQLVCLHLIRRRFTIKYAGITWIDVFLLFWTVISRDFLWEINYVYFVSLISRPLLQFWYSSTRTFIVLSHRILHSCWSIISCWSNTNTRLVVLRKITLDILLRARDVIVCCEGLFQKLYSIGIIQFVGNVKHMCWTHIDTMQWI